MQEYNALPGSFRKPSNVTRLLHIAKYGPLRSPREEEYEGSTMYSLSIFIYIRLIFSCASLMVVHFPHLNTLVIL